MPIFFLNDIIFKCAKQKLVTVNDYKFVAKISSPNDVILNCQGVH